LNGHKRLDIKEYPKTEIKLTFLDVIGRWRLANSYFYIHYRGREYAWLSVA
jgi:hypothetical protein